MSEDDFLEVINKNRNPLFWTKTSTGEWVLKDPITNHINLAGVKEVRLQKKENCNFAVTLPRDKNANEDEYVLIGRGWVEK